MTDIAQVVIGGLDITNTIISNDKNQNCLKNLFWKLYKLTVPCTHKKTFRIEMDACACYHDMPQIIIN
jgi:hypothetical protein